MAEPFNARDLRAAGEALFGEDWESALCGAMDVTLAQIRSWSRGSSPVPSRVLAEIAVIAEDRAGELTRLARDLRKRL